MSNVIRSTQRLSTIEMEGCFLEAAASLGITIEDLRKSQSLPVDFVYSLLEIVSTRAVVAELNMSARSLDLSNHQVRQIASAIEAPSATGSAQPSRSSELTVREMRLMQGILKDRSDSIKSRVQSIESSIEVN